MVSKNLWSKPRFSRTKPFHHVKLWNSPCLLLMFSVLTYIILSIYPTWFPVARNEPLAAQDSGGSVPRFLRIGRGAGRRLHRLRRLRRLRSALKNFSDYLVGGFNHPEKY
jgi:hypothetical protein